MIPALGPGEEFDRIRAVARALGDAAAGLDDDCALLPPGAGMLAASTDVSVEGVHFRLDWISLREAGWRAASAALADLAAEGAEPVGLLAAVVAPRGAGEGELVELMRGVGDSAAAAGTVVLGGDLARAGADGGWSVAVTVLGRAAHPVTRAGARPGDGLWVTGALGGARAALEAWRRGDAPDPDARQAFAAPVPRLAAGRWLAGHGARAMLDISDGLAGDAAHLAAASGVAIELELELVPVHPSAIPAARRLELPVQQFAAEAGEDYELLAALPDGFGAAEAREFERVCGIALTRIGRAARGTGVRAGLAGRPLSLRGFDHFR
ncbi:MAG TPA: thiamine-phosphate kinase [Gemmatimonadales bacterium]